MENVIQHSYTEGEHIVPPSVNDGVENTPAPDHDFDQKTWESALNISAPAGMPKPETFDPTPVELAQPLNASDKTTELGQITTIENAIAVTPVADRPGYNPTNIKTSGDRLEKSSIGEIDNAIDELNQTGNLSNFYDEIRGEGSMLEANLHNSFNRKLYDDKGEQ